MSLRDLGARLSICLAAVAATSAHAVDGVREINQVCATQTGCFPGDSAGFPVLIGGSAGKSFRLTSDLAVSTTTADAIVISTSDVELDLAGFSIRGPAVCSGDPIGCTPSTGSGAGVSSSGLHRGVEVRDGSVVGMGVGVSLGNDAVVRGLRVRSNVLEGAKALGNARIERVLAYQNGGTGISISSGIVDGCASQSNGKVGIYFNSTTGTGTARGNVVRANGNDGIVASGTLLASGNVVTHNFLDGISSDVGSQIVSNVASENGADGVQVTGESAILENTVRANAGFGIRTTGSGIVYRGNTINGNVAGTVTAVPPVVNQGANSCNGTASCP